MSADAQDRSDRGAYGLSPGLFPLPPPSADCPPVLAPGDLPNDDEHIPLQIFVPELVLQVCAGARVDYFPLNVGVGALGRVSTEFPTTLTL